MGPVRPIRWFDRPIGAVTSCAPGEMSAHRRGLGILLVTVAQPLCLVDGVEVLVRAYRDRGEEDGRTGPARSSGRPGRLGRPGGQSQEIGRQLRLVGGVQRGGDPLSEIDGPLWRIGPLDPRRTCHRAVFRRCPRCRGRPAATPVCRLGSRRRRHDRDIDCRAVPVRPVERYRDGRAIVFGVLGTRVPAWSGRRIGACGEHSGEDEDDDGGDEHERRVTGKSMGAIVDTVAAVPHHPAEPVPLTLP